MHTLEGGTALNAGLETQQHRQATGFHLCCVLMLPQAAGFLQLFVLG
jgi:hypothetical protein